MYAGDWLIGERRRDGLDVSRFLLQHRLHCELSDVVESQQVGRDQGIEVFGRKVGERLCAEDFSVIHQHIDGSKVPHRGFDTFVGGALPADIAIDGTRFGEVVNDRLTSRDVAMTLEPSFRKASTKPAPMPCGAPVTIAVFLSNIHTSQPARVCNSSRDELTKALTNAAISSAAVSNAK
jgi:hypothetical protein